MFQMHELRIRSPIPLLHPTLPRRGIWGVLDYKRHAAIAGGGNKMQLDHKGFFAGADIALTFLTLNPKP